MAALTQDVVDYHGKYFDFTNVPVEMKPLQKPHPPMWYATNAPDSAARVARQNMNMVNLLGAPQARAAHLCLQGCMGCRPRRKRHEDA